VYIYVMNRDLSTKISIRKRLQF